MLAVVLVVAAPAIVLVTRALTGQHDLKAVDAPGDQAAGLSSLSPVVASPAGPPQSCSSCWVDKGAPAPAVPGRTTLVDGVQVVNVGLVEGYYRPNRFTVEAGVPVTVVFTGWAQDCLGQPELPELGLKGDLAGGRAVFPLGALAPGAYTFTCSMGVNEGVITAE